MANLMAPSAPAPSAAPEQSQNTNAQQATGEAISAPQVGTPKAGNAATPQAQKAAANARKTYQLKIDGKEEKFDFDPTNEEELVKHLQMSRVSQKRMQQFSEYENNVKGLFELLQKDPIKVLGDPRLGISEEVRQKMAQSIINNEIEELQKSPEQRERDRLQKEYENLKKAHEEEKQARDAADFSRLQDQYASQLDTDISAAIQQQGLPKTARTVRYMAEALMFCVQNNIPMGAKDLGSLIKKQTLGDFRDMISSLPDEDFEDWLGKDQITRIRKRTLARVKNAAQQASDVRSTGTKSQDKSSKTDKKVPMKDFFKALGGKY
jgi:hypothetical protein